MQKNKNYFENAEYVDSYPKVESKKMLGRHNNSAIVTYVIPTYKRRDLLKKCVKSILNQNTVYSYEIIIIDNDSENFNNYESEIYSMLFDYKDDKINYYVNSENINGQSWNRCFALAQTEWVCMVHDDDEIKNNHLETIYNFIKNNECDCVCCGLQAITKKGKSSIESENITDKTFKRMLVKEHLGRFQASLLGTFIKKEVFLKLGGFTLNTPISDYIFMTKCLFYYKVFKTSCSLYRYGIYVNDSLNADTHTKVIMCDYDFWKFLSKKTKANLREKFRIRYEIALKIYSLKKGYFNKNIKFVGCSNVKKIQKYCHMSNVELYFLANVIFSLYHKIIKKDINNVL